MILATDINSVNMCIDMNRLLKDGLQASCGQYETHRPLALATLLDPPFKNLGFGNKAQEAEKQLTLECATLMQPAETPGDKLNIFIFIVNSLFDHLIYYHYYFRTSNLHGSDIIFIHSRRRSLGHV